MSPEKTRIAKWAKRRSAPEWWTANTNTDIQSRIPSIIPSTIHVATV
jgi:hypothetical protein